MVVVRVGGRRTIRRMAWGVAPTIAPVPGVNRTGKYLVLVGGVVFKMGTLNVLFEASPSAHVNVPASAVNCLPARAVSATVLQDRDNAPWVPPLRRTVQVWDPAGPPPPSTLAAHAPPTVSAAGVFLSAKPFARST